MKLKRASCDWQAPEHRPSACTPSGHSVRFFCPCTAECNSAGRTDLEVCIPSCLQAERRLYFCAKGYSWPPYRLSEWAESRV